MRSLLASLPASIKSFSCRSLQSNPTAWRGSVIIPLHLATLFSLPSARDEPRKPRHEAAPCCEPGYFLPARAAPCRLPTGACWTRWVLIRRQLAAATDPPTIGLFLPLSCDLFIFFLCTFLSSPALERRRRRWWRRWWWWWRMRRRRWWRSG